MIMAGGQATRMGGRDKGLIPLQNRPMIEHVIERLQPQISTILINANRNLAHYQAYGLPVIQDQTTAFLGPLSGLLAGLCYCTTPFVITVPCDAPRIPTDYIARLCASTATLCAVSTGGHLQPTFARVHQRYTDNLQAYLDQGQRAAGQWLRRNHCDPIDFSDQLSGFVNLNQLDDITQWEQSYLDEA